MATKETRIALDAMMDLLDGYLFGSSLSVVCANTVSEAIVACALSHFQLILVTDTVANEKDKQASILPFVRVLLDLLI